MMTTPIKAKLNTPDQHKFQNYLNTGCLYFTLDFTEALIALELNLLSS